MGRPQARGWGGGWGWGGEPEAWGEGRDGQAGGGASPQPRPARLRPRPGQVFSQHPYAENFIGKPHVWTVDYNNSEEFEAAIQAILRTQVRGRPRQDHPEPTSAPSL